MLLGMGTRAAALGERGSFQLCHLGSEGVFCSCEKTRTLRTHASGSVASSLQESAGIAFDAPLAAVPTSQRFISSAANLLTYCKYKYKYNYHGQRRGGAILHQTLRMAFAVQPRRREDYDRRGAQVGVCGKYQRHGSLRIPHETG